MAFLDGIVHRLTADNLRRQRGNKDFVRAVQELSTLSVVKWEDDFIGDTLHSGYTLNTDGGTSLTIATATADGAATMVTAATTEKETDMSLNLEWAADQQCVMAALISVNSIADVKFEVGFTDVIVGTDLGAVNVLATPNYNAADAAVWVFDTDDTGNVALQGVGVDTGTGATKYEPANVGNADADAAPNANITMLLMVALNDSGDARYLYGDMSSNGTTDKNRMLKITQDSGWIEDSITPTVALTPYVFIQARTGTAKTLTLDYFGAWQYRYNAD
jgi:hypothetical protein